jgi:predicted TIM-barrel fold metal-dependent hydrolase
MGVPFQLQLGVLHVIDGGVLERHPGLRIGFFEGDVGWLAHWLGRLDQTYDKMALVVDRPARGALEQFRDQCVISGEPADAGLGLTVDAVGADRVLWASDWPHLDGSWPDPVTILRDRGDLDETAKRAMFFQGAARFYGIDMAALMRHLGPGWSPTAGVGDLGGLLSRAR